MAQCQWFFIVCLIIMSCIALFGEDTQYNEGRLHGAIILLTSLFFLFPKLFIDNFSEIFQFKIVPINKATVIDFGRLGVLVSFIISIVTLIFVIDYSLLSIYSFPIPGLAIYFFIKALWDTRKNKRKIKKKRR